MSSNDLVETYLSAFFAGDEFDTGLSFRTALTQARLDYSPESIDRIDQLLDQLRVNKTPEFSVFYNDYANQTFMYLLGFYVGTYVARAAGLHITWHKHDELTENTRRNVELRFCTSMTCYIGQSGPFFSIGDLEGRLFALDGSTSIASRAEHLVALVKRESNETLLLRTQNALPATAPSVFAPEFGTTAEVLGWLAAFSIWDVAGGSTMYPWMASGNNVVRQLRFDLKEAVTEGHSRLDNNPENEARLALAYDGYTTCSHGRTDAIILKARYYPPQRSKHAAGPAWNIHLALPYRPKVGKQRFAVGHPRVIACDTEVDALGWVAQAFYAGVDSFRQPKEVWPKEIQEPW